MSHISSNIRLRDKLFGITSRIWKFFLQIRSNILWLKDTEKVLAVHSEDVTDLEFLLPLKGTHCYFCGTELTEENLGGWIRIEGQLVSFCNSVDCMPVFGEEEDDKH